MTNADSIPENGQFIWNPIFWLTQAQVDLAPDNDLIKKIIAGEEDKGKYILWNTFFSNDNRIRIDFRLGILKYALENLTPREIVKFFEELELHNLDKLPNEEQAKINTLLSGSIKWIDSARKLITIFGGTNKWHTWDIVLRSVVDIYGTTKSKYSFPDRYKKFWVNYYDSAPAFWPLINTFCPSSPTEIIATISWSSRRDITMHNTSNIINERTDKVDITEFKKTLIANSDNFLVILRYIIKLWLFSGRQNFWRNCEEDFTWLNTDDNYEQIFNSAVDLLKDILSKNDPLVLQNIFGVNSTWRKYLLPWSIIENERLLWYQDSTWASKDVDTILLGWVDSKAINPEYLERPELLAAYRRLLDEKDILEDMLNKIWEKEWKDYYDKIKSEPDKLWEIPERYIIFEIKFEWFSDLWLEERKKRINSAFRRLAQKFHPDRNKADDAGEKMKNINAIREEFEKNGFM